jgi:cell division septum initiation protein DivIVA
LNFIETLLQQVQQLQKQNQELRDEINRLKGEKGNPIVLPNSKKPVDISSQARSEEKKDWQKKSKKAIIPIDQKIDCPID